MTVTVTMTRQLVPWEEVGQQERRRKDTSLFIDVAARHRIVGMRGETISLGLQDLLRTIPVRLVSTSSTITRSLKHILRCRRIYNVDIGQDETAYSAITETVNPLPRILISGSCTATSGKDPNPQSGDSSLNQCSAHARPCDRRIGFVCRIVASHDTERELACPQSMSSLPPCSYYDVDYYYAF